MDYSRGKEAASTMAATYKALTLMLSISATAALAFHSTDAHSESAWALEKPLVPYTASYVVGNDLVQAGKAHVELKQNDNDQWLYSLTTEPMGLFKLAGRGYVTESSIFAVVDQDNTLVIQPKSYKFRQDNEKKRAVDATFNWGQMQLYSSRGTKNTQAPLTAATLDRMTMTITMMSTLKSDFEDYTLNVYDGGRIKQVQLVNEGTESIKTRLGQLETIRVKTRSLKSSRRETLTWLAPALNNLPVQIEQIKEGKLVARLSVSEYTQR